MCYQIRDIVGRVTPDKSVRLMRTDTVLLSLAGRPVAQNDNSTQAPESHG